MSTKKIIPSTNYYGGKTSHHTSLISFWPADSLCEEIVEMMHFSRWSWKITVKLNVFKDENSIEDFKAEKTSWHFIVLPVLSIMWKLWQGIAAKLGIFTVDLEKWSLAWIKVKEYKE